ncbi:MAG: hypothetical protein HFF99_01215 [Oscillibacter sp.]|nr:hypothetical protein [uncultured Oscillibacter sp.]MCI8970057.1 hypothetical protein [Oscillibacter sp.]
MSSREDLRRFYALGIDHSVLGLEPWPEQCAGYFCTPVEAEIFGGPGVDGVHYILLPEDERVFCVNPGMGEPGTYILPVAENFREFLAFLLCCRDESPLAQLWWLDEEKFRRLLEENAQNRWPGCEETFAKTDAALAAVAETFGLEPQDPFRKVKALQEAFDPAGLTFSEEYYDTLGLEHPGTA